MWGAPQPPWAERRWRIVGMKKMKGDDAGPGSVALSLVRDPVGAALRSGKERTVDTLHLGGIV